MRITKDIAYITDNAGNAVPIKWESIIRAVIHPKGPLTRIITDKGVSVKEQVTCRKLMIEALARKIKNLFKYEDERDVVYLLRPDFVDWLAVRAKTGWREIAPEESYENRQRRAIMLRINKETGEQHEKGFVPPYQFIRLVAEAVQEGRLDSPLAPGFYYEGKEYGFDDVVFMLCTRLAVTVYFNDGKRAEVDGENGSLLADRMKNYADRFVFACTQPGETGSIYVHRSYIDLKATEATAVNWSGSLIRMLTADNHAGKQISLPEARLTDTGMQLLKQRLAGKTPYLTGEVSSISQPIGNKYNLPEATTEIIWLRTARSPREMTYGLVELAQASVSKCKAISSVLLVPEASICWEKTAETPRGICVCKCSPGYDSLMSPEEDSYDDGISEMRGENSAHVYFRGSDSERFQRVELSTERYIEIAAKFPEGCSLDNGYIWSSKGKVPLSDILMYSTRAPKNPDKDHDSFWVREDDRREYELSMRLVMIRASGGIMPGKLSFSKVLSRIETMPGRKFVYMNVYTNYGHEAIPMKADAAAIDLNETRNHSAWIPGKDTDGITCCRLLYALSIKGIGRTFLYIDQEGLEGAENAIRG